MNIGIIGLGVVGNSIYSTFKKKNINVMGYDKYNSRGNITKLDEILSCEILFLCLPTPFDEKLKSYNKEALDETMLFLHNKKYNGFILIKSTVEPTVCDNYYNQYNNLKILHNPEFISAISAEKDFENQKYTLIGKTNIDENINMVIDFYKKYFININIIINTSLETEVTKIAANSFYATKIQYFNEIYDLCNKTNCNYNIVRDMMLESGWINKMHTNVPGSDGKFSYGGMCFPKDTSAYYNFLKKNSEYYEIAKATVEQNKSIRK